jgi:phosphoribosylanthranilate isomerase
MASTAEERPREARKPGRIHVAGVMDLAEAELLIECGVEHVGFPLVLGHHAEDLSHEAAAAIVARLADRSSFFLITYLATASEIIALCRRLKVAAVQLHGPIAAGELRRLRAAWPELYVIKSLIVRGDNLDALAEEVGRFAPVADAFITDTFDAETGACGATGKLHDWAVSARLVELSPRPVILAGGLNPDNVREAIIAVQPAGVDVHTGVEGADGRKQRGLVERFVAEAQAGLAVQMLKS